MLFLKKLSPLLKDQTLAVNRSISMLLSREGSPINSNSSVYSSQIKYDSYDNLPIIGIDFGTTKSCVAVMDGNVPKVLENEEGSRTTPSVVAIMEGGYHLVGAPAKRQALFNPKSTFYSIKKLLGHKFADNEVQNYMKHVPFGINGEENNDLLVGANVNSGITLRYSPDQIAASVLKKLKNTAEMQLKRKIDRAFITVPTNFNDIQEIKNAGEMAGFKRIDVISEPIAAALASGFNESCDHTIAVYNFGGGKFEISIVRCIDGVLKVDSKGDELLGGDDFDNVLLNHFHETFKKESGIDLSDNVAALQRLKEAAADAKIQLSRVTEVEIHIPNLAIDSYREFKHFNYKLMRKEYENLVDDLLKRTVQLCEEVFEETEIDKEDIKEVLLIGGMTKMPMVKKTVEEIFEQSPSHKINPDEALAIGAAIAARKTAYYTN